MQVGDRVLTLLENSFLKGRTGTILKPATDYDWFVALDNLSGDSNYAFNESELQIIEPELPTSFRIGDRVRTVVTADGSNWADNIVGTIDSENENESDMQWLVRMDGTGVKVAFRESELEHLTEEETPMTYDYNEFPMDEPTGGEAFDEDTFDAFMASMYDFQENDAVVEETVTLNFTAVNSYGDSQDVNMVMTGPVTAERLADMLGRFFTSVVG